MFLWGLIVRGAGHRVRTPGQASLPYHSLISSYLLTMAYRRPLTYSQMIVIALLWLALVVWILVGSPRLDGITLLTLAASGVIVFYPIIKSYRERK